MRQEKNWKGSDKNSWITERLDEIEKHKLNQDTLPFKIVEAKNSGFLAKVKGLYAFIGFNYMPWKYDTVDEWKAMAPSLTGNTFMCNIVDVNRDNNRVTLNGDVPQFDKAELTPGKKYIGLIIKIAKYGVFIDIGYHFDWKYGSLRGLLHKSLLAENEKMYDFVVGQEIMTVYQEHKDEGSLTFCNNQKKIERRLAQDLAEGRYQS